MSPWQRRSWSAFGAGIAAAFVLAFPKGSYSETPGNPPDELAIRFDDVNGRVHTPLTQPGKAATVFFFLLPDCPISNSYAPEIKRICADYEGKKVALFVVHADPDVSVDQAKKHAAEYGLLCPVLRDPSHVLVKRTGVTMAPEVAVLGPDRKMLYRGRIDDLYMDYGKRRAAPTQRDLRNALDALLQGKAVPTPTTKALGCHLPDPKTGG
jgi:AhpC/TSA family